MLSVRNLLWTTIAALLIAHVVLLSTAPIELRTVAALCIAAYIPGFLLIHWLDLPPFRGWLPALTATVAAGIAVQTWLTLFALYTPGVLSRSRLLAVFDLFTVALLLLILWSRRRRLPKAIAAPAELSNKPHTATYVNSSARIVVIASALLLLTVAVYFRFAGLGASQFQGDEATAIVYAAAIAQGHEEVIFQHRRGPVDILIPASTMVLTGAANEAALRLPFAIAALAGVAAIFLLGGLLFGGLAGWLAALLAAFDGYLIGFGRVMHYESVVVLTAALGVYVLYQLLQAQKAATATKPGNVRRALLLTALLLATGMAAHYDGAAALIPAGYLLWRLWRTGFRGRAFVHALWPPVAGAALLLLAFYAPYLLNPYFRETLEFYTGTLAGAPADAQSVNHLAMLVESLLLYNGGLKTVLMIGTPACGLILLFWQQPRRRFRLLALFAALGFLAVLVTAYIPIPGLRDWMPFLFAVLVVGAVAAPRQTDAERVLWLWLLLPFFVAMFVVQQPGLHFYFFVTPWLLLTGWLLDRLHRWLQVRSGKPLVAGVGIGLLIAGTIVFGVHAYRFFIDPAELAQNYRRNFAPPAWWPAANYDNSQLLYGIPHREGWKTIGALYASGALTGSYNANIDRWTVDWYTRGAEYCRDNPDQIVIELATRSEQAAALLEDAGSDYAVWGVIEVEGRPALHIYRRNVSGAPWVADAADDERLFDEMLSSTGNTALTPRVILPMTPANLQFGSELVMTGFAIQNPGDNGQNLALTAAWTAQARPQMNYQIRIELVDANGKVVGQRTADLSCQAGPTTEWKPGKQAEGYYRIPFSSVGRRGDYTVQAGLVDANGTIIGEVAPLATVTIQ